MIVILMACKAELPPTFKQQYPTYWTRIQELQSGGYHKYKHLPLLIIITGVNNASKNATQWIIQNIKPTEIINIGTAGSKKIAKNTWASVKNVIKNNNTITINQHQSLPIPTHTYPSVTCETIDNKKTLNTGDIVDMESAYIATECKKHNIPCSIMKYITDKNDQNTDIDFNKNLQAFQHSLDTYLNHLFKPKPSTISVIVPTHNRPLQVNTALESVVNQTHPPHQIICIDDQSSPPIKQTFKQVQYIRLPKQSGVSTARNTGVQQATGEWIAFLDSDDTWETNHLETCIKYLNTHPYMQWVQTDEKWIRNSQHLNKKKYHKKPTHWGWRPSLERCLVTPSAVIIHHSLFKQHGTFNQKMLACEDYDLWLRFLRHIPIGYIPIITVTKYGGHPDQLSTKYHAMDNFRVYSLIEQYNKETTPSFKKDIKNVLQKKMSILIQGAQKRNNTRTLALYKTIIEQLNLNTLIPTHIYETLLLHAGHNKN